MENFIKMKIKIMNENKEISMKKNNKVVNAPIYFILIKRKGSMIFFIFNFLANEYFHEFEI
jgi:hypothetical protein